MTKLDIFNAALATVSNERFLSSVDATFAEAVHCRREWPHAKRAVLAAHDWNWCAVELPVTAGDISLDGAPDLYMFPRPDESLRLVGLVGPDGRRLRWKASSGIIYTSAPEASIRYIPDSEEPETWPLEVCDAVSQALAERIAVPLRRDPRMLSYVADKARAALQAAIAVDAGEQRSTGTKGDKYAKARL